MITEIDAVRHVRGKGHHGKGSRGGRHSGVIATDPIIVSVPPSSDPAEGSTPDSESIDGEPERDMKPETSPISVEVVEPEGEGEDEPSPPTGIEEEDPVPESTPGDGEEGPSESDDDASTSTDGDVSVRTVETTTATNVVQSNADGAEGNQRMVISSSKATVVYGGKLYPSSTEAHVTETDKGSDIKDAAGETYEELLAKEAELRQENFHAVKNIRHDQDHVRHAMERHREIQIEHDRVVDAIEMLLAEHKVPKEKYTIPPLAVPENPLAEIKEHDHQEEEEMRTSFEASAGKLSKENEELKQKVYKLEHKLDLAEKQSKHLLKEFEKQLATQQTSKSSIPPEAIMEKLDMIDAHLRCNKAKEDAQLSGLNCNDSKILQKLDMILANQGKELGAVEATKQEIEAETEKIDEMKDEVEEQETVPTTPAPEAAETTAAAAEEETTAAAEEETTAAAEEETTAAAEEETTTAAEEETTTAAEEETTTAAEEGTTTAAEEETTAAAEEETTADADEATEPPPPEESESPTGSEEETEEESDEEAAAEVDETSTTEEAATGGSESEESASTGAAESESSESDEKTVTSEPAAKEEESTTGGPEGDVSGEGKDEPAAENSTPAPGGEEEGEPAAENSTPAPGGEEEGEPAAEEGEPATEDESSAERNVRFRRKTVQLLKEKKIDDGLL